jgi:myo-inositol 2-dehydrogenase/D-chiro-inositol 1-dehydrogenase
MNPNEIGAELNRRQFLTRATGTVAGVVAATALNPLIGLAQTNQPAAVSAAPKRKIKLGQIGLGGRGAWLADLFVKHGGYEYIAVADYFPEVSAAQGRKLGVPAERCFSGLSGYKKVIESGVEAIIVLDVPYFYPEQVKDAVAAGLHVYMAKPVAVDVPGALSIGESGKLATQKQLVFLVDFQMPTDPLILEVTKCIGTGGIGKLQTIFSIGAGGGPGCPDPSPTENIESRLKSLVWANYDALGCGYIGNYDIHIVEAVLRAVGRLPDAAYGWGAQFRPAPHGDTLDTWGLMFEFGDHLIWNHQSARGTSDDWFESNGALSAEFQGSEASARLSYHSKAFVRGGTQILNGKVENLYLAGPMRNIATFYDAVANADNSNATVQPAVDSVLACVLGRETAARKTRLTMAEVLKENRKLEVNLKGLKI